MDLSQWIIIGLCVILGLWFAAGYLYNWQKVRVISQALKTALEKLGGLSAYRRLGVSGAQFILDKVGAPFRQIEMVFLLEPRENLPLWLFQRIQGRRDEILLKANLRTVLAQEIQIGQSRDREFKKQVLMEQQKPYEWIPAAHGLEIARRGGRDDALLARLGRFLERFGKVVRRVSIQRKEPHLIVKARLSTLKSMSADEFLMAIRDVVQQGSPD